MANKTHFVGQKRHPRQPKYCVAASVMVVNRAKSVRFFHRHATYDGLTGSIGNSATRTKLPAEKPPEVHNR